MGLKCTPRPTPKKRTCNIEKEIFELTTSEWCCKKQKQALLNLFTVKIHFIEPIKFSPRMLRYAMTIIQQSAIPEVSGHTLKRI